ncbi:hypothetical protein [Treponema sp. R80B11-R83G3]
MPRSRGYWALFAQRKELFAIRKGRQLSIIPDKTNAIIANEFNGLNNTAIINTLIINRKAFDLSDIQYISIAAPCAKKIIAQITNTFHAKVPNISILKIPLNTIVANAPDNTQIAFAGAENVINPRSIFCLLTIETMLIAS